MCLISYAIYFSSLMVSIFHLMFIAIDRYITIRKISSAQNSHKSCPIIIILMSWIIPICGVWWTLSYNDYDMFMTNINNNECKVFIELKQLTIYIIVYLILPYVITIIMYLMIYVVSVGSFNTKYSKC